MSDLKHRSVDELREEIASSVRYRDRLEREWTGLEAHIERLKVDIASLRRKHHNAGQREAWARIYLAQKT
jgi:hypothetical protein